MALKGTTRIELTNVKTGEVEVIEKHNLVTNAVADILSMNPGGIFFRNYSNSYDGEIGSSFANKFFPICRNLIGGILLYEDPLEEDPDKYYADQSNKLVGYASNDVNPGSETMRGSLNQTESGVVDGSLGYRYVFDFGTNQGNGKISALGLTSPYGGANGYGSAKNPSNEYRKPLLCVYDGYRGDYTGRYADNPSVLAWDNIVSIDYEKDIGYFAYMSAQKTITVGKVRMNLKSVGLREYYPDYGTILESQTVSTNNFAATLYTSNFFYGTLIDGGDGYIWGFQHSGNAKGNSSGKATVLWVKVSKEDWSVEEGTWTIDAQLSHFGQEGNHANSSYDIRETCAVIHKGNLYAYKYNANGYYGYIYEIPLSNVTAVKLYDSTRTIYRDSSADYPVCRLNILDGRVADYDHVINGENFEYVIPRSPQHGHFSVPSGRMGVYYCRKPGLTHGPFLFAFGARAYTGGTAAQSSYNYRYSIFLQMCFLATINNLPTPVEKTADKTMKITYILREES